jgi:hypothetical protein
MKPVPNCDLIFVSELTIDVASVADHRNIDLPSGVIDAINDSIVANSNSPKILVTLKSNNAGRSGNRCQGLDALHYAARYGGVKFLEFLPSRTSECDRVISHSPWRGASAA